ncbi:MAG: hypothetical protein SGPRY_010311 [Prymnesium sp.]
MTNLKAKRVDRSFQLLASTQRSEGRGEQFDIARERDKRMCEGRAEGLGEGRRESEEGVGALRERVAQVWGGGVCCRLAMSVSRVANALINERFALGG